MPKVLFPVQGRAEHHAAPLQHIVRQSGKRPAGAGVPPDVRLPIPGGEGGGKGPGLTLLKHGASSGADAAADALLQVHLGNREALPVPDQGNGVLGTGGGAGGAAGAVGPVRQKGAVLPGQGRFRPLVGLVRQGGFQIGHGSRPGGGQPRLRGGPIRAVPQPGGVPLAHHPFRQSQAAQQAERPGALRLLELRRGHGGKEGALEQDGKHRPMEGVGTDVGGALKQAQKLRRARVGNHPGLGVELPPGAAELNHRQFRLLRQAADIGLQGPGPGNAVAEDILLFPERRVRRQGGPLRRRQQQRGVQNHRRLPAGGLPDDLPAGDLPDGEVGKALQIALQFLLHSLGEAGHAEGGSVGDLPQGGERAEKHRVEAPVRENGGIPDLVAAGDQQVIGQLRPAQLLPALIAPVRQSKKGAGKVLKPLPAPPDGGVVQGVVSVAGRQGRAGRRAEDAGILVDEIVDGLALPPQGLQGPLGGGGLEDGPVVVEMIKRKQSRFQTNNPLSHRPQRDTVSSPAIQSATGITSNSVSVRRMTTRSSPALMTRRRHMEQEVASWRSPPSLASRPAR